MGMDTNWDVRRSWMSFAPWLNFASPNQELHKENLWNRKLGLH